MTAECEPQTPKHPHWPTIEADYRAGVKSIRQIAREHGLSETAIRKRAKAEDWTRDLSAAIQAKADDLVRREAVRTEVRNANHIPDKVVVDANATAIYRVQLAHRAGLAKLSDLRDQLLTELSATAPNAPQPPGDAAAAAGEAEEGDAATAPASLALPVRIESLKKLSEVDEKIRRGEREAYGIDKAQPTDEGGFASKLTDAERASRLAALFALARKRAEADAP